MPLTKKYRLIWNTATKELLINPLFSHTGKTWVGATVGCFETNDMGELNEKIIELKLIFPASVGFKKPQ